MKILLFKSNIAANVETRMETFNDRQHLVVPVVMMVEGVHSNNAGPSLYPLEEFSKIPQAWNGVPVPINHPSDTSGSPISIGDPVAVQQLSIGNVWNSRMEGDKLKAELWLDVLKADQIAPGLLNSIRAGEEIDVSTGHFSENEIVPGNFQGETFDQVVRNIVPDHLAILPGARGACSWSDGCGIRANKKGGDMKVNVVQENSNVVQISVDVERKFEQKDLDRLEGVIINELSHEDVRHQLQKEVDKLDSNLGSEMARMHFVKNVFDDNFVFEMSSRGETKLFQQDFEINDDIVELKGDPKEVQEKITFVEVNAIQTNKEDKNMPDKKCCEEKIQLLIENEATHWVEDDRTFLETLDEKQIDKLEPIVKKDEPVVNKDEPKPKDEPVKKDEPATMDEFLANAGEFGPVLSDGLRMYNDRKAKLVKALVENKRCSFTEDELKAKDIGELERLGTLAQVSADYSVNAGPGEPKANESQETPLSTPSFAKPKE